MACSGVFTLFSTAYGQPSCVLACLALSAYFPLFYSRWTLLGDLRLLYGLAYFPRWFSQHQLPLVVSVSVSDMDYCALGLPVRKFLCFSGFLGNWRTPYESSTWNTKS